MYGQEYGYVPQHEYGNPLDNYLKLKDKQEQDQRYQDQLARQQRQYQDGLLAQAMEQLDFKHFATGTQLDPVIHNSLSSALKTVSQKIMDNPDASSASVYYDVANAANDIAAYSQKARNIRTNVEAASKEYAKNPSLDAAKLAQTSLTNAFTKYDPTTHTYKVKDPSEIDDSQDWVGNTLQNNPEQVVKGSGALDLLLKNSDKKNYEQGFLVDKDGVKRNQVFKGEYFPYNKIETDPTGKPIFDPSTGQARVGVRSEDYQGTPIANKDDLAYFTSDPGAKAYLDAQVKNMGIDPNSDQGQLVKRRILYNHLQSNNQGYINRTKDEVDQSQLQSENFQRAMKAWSESLKEALKGSGKNGEDVNIKNVYKDIEEKGKNKTYGIPLNELNPDSQAVLMKHANAMLGKDERGATPNVSNIWVRNNHNGTWSLMQSKEAGHMDYSGDTQVSPLDFVSLNTMYGTNPSKSERQTVLKQGDQTKPTTSRPPLTSFVKK